MIILSLGDTRDRIPHTASRC